MVRIRLWPSQAGLFFSFFRGAQPGWAFGIEQACICFVIMAHKPAVTILALFGNFSQAWVVRLRAATSRHRPLARHRIQGEAVAAQTTPPAARKITYPACGSKLEAVNLNAV